MIIQGYSRYPDISAGSQFPDAFPAYRLVVSLKQPPLHWQGGSGLAAPSRSNTAATCAAQEAAAAAGAGSGSATLLRLQPSPPAAAP